MRLLNLTDPKDYEVWMAGLADLPDSALRIGLAKAKDFTEFLSLGRFRELCHVKPEDLGLPNTRAAMYEACQAPMPKPDYNWSHPAVFWAGVNVGWYDMQNKTEHELFPIFEAAYEQLVARVLNGETLESPVRKRLPPSVHIPAEPNYARAALSRMKEMIP